MTRTETLSIAGMSCAHCVRAVRSALESVPGLTVDDVRVGEAQVRYEEGVVPREAIAEAVDREGYPLREAGAGL